MQNHPTVRVRCTTVSRRRQQRREEKARRHGPPLPPAEVRWPGAQPIPTIAPRQPGRPRTIVRPTSYVERLAYTRSQAAEALGISPSTLRRLLPYIETIDMPWGTRLIPVDELERLVAERRRRRRATKPSPTRQGRRTLLDDKIAARIRREHHTGHSLAEIARRLNYDHIPTAHGGRQWWPSTVRDVLHRRPA